MEKVSVLMSVYRNEKASYLYKAIQSMLTQTVMPAEIVIVADGPLIPSLKKVLHDYQCKYPDIFSIYYLAQNHGLAYALAYGLQRCKYNLVARMDTDDIAVPQRLAWSLKAMAAHHYDIYGGQIAEFDGDENNIIAHRKVPFKQADIVRFAHRRNPMNHMSVMYRRDKILKIGNYHSLNGFEDYDLWVRALRAGYQLGNDERVFVYVRAGKEMMARRGGFDYLKRNIKMRFLFYKEHFYSWQDLFITTLGISVTNLMPEKLRYLIYYKLLRK